LLAQHGAALTLLAEQLLKMETLDGSAVKAAIATAAAPDAGGKVARNASTPPPG